MSHLLETFPVLHTKRLLLTELTEADKPALYDLFTNPQITDSYHVFPFKEVEDLQQVIVMFRKRFAEQNMTRWGLTKKETNEFIGTIGFSQLTPKHKASVVYAIHPRYWRKGYATEALQEVIKFAFDVLGINRIEAEVMPDNKASGLLLQKAGFTYEGLLRQWTMWQGKYYDMDMYALLRASQQEK